MLIIFMFKNVHFCEIQNCVYSYWANRPNVYLALEGQKTFKTKMFLIYG